jgi:glycosyltransferase involved in cell wall biosynthesis
VIHDRENGLLVENTPEAIAEGIRELAGNPAFARKLGQAGRRTVSEWFTVDRMVNRTMEIYRGVLA